MVLIPDRKFHIEVWHLQGSQKGALREVYTKGYFARGDCSMSRKPSQIRFHRFLNDWICGNADLCKYTFSAPASRHSTLFAESRELSRQRSIRSCEQSCWNISFIISSFDSTGISLPPYTLSPLSTHVCNLSRSEMSNQRKFLIWNRKLLFESSVRHLTPTKP